MRDEPGDGLSPVARWRNLVRDSDLDSTAKVVGFVLSTYMSHAGVAWPGKQLLAEGAGLAVAEWFNEKRNRVERSTRAVDGALKRLQAAGLLEVDPPKPGRNSNTYRAIVAPLATALNGHQPDLTRDPDKLTRADLAYLDD